MLGGVLEDWLLEGFVGLDLTKEEGGKCFRL